MEIHSSPYQFCLPNKRSKRNLLYRKFPANAYLESCIYKHRNLYKPKRQACDGSNDLIVGRILWWGIQPIRINNNSLHSLPVFQDKLSFLRGTIFKKPIMQRAPIPFTIQFPINESSTVTPISRLPISNSIKLTKALILHPLLLRTRPD